MNDQVDLLTTNVSQMASWPQLPGCGSGGAHDMVGMLLFSSILVRGEEEATLQTCYVLMTNSVDELNWTRWKGPRSCAQGQPAFGQLHSAQRAAYEGMRELQHCKAASIDTYSHILPLYPTGCNRSGAHSAGAELADGHKTVHGHRLVS